MKEKGAEERGGQEAGSGLRKRKLAELGKRNHKGKESTTKG